ncbi:diguanylate cyclase domain-containing protein [Paenibacillus sp. p3-SID867]|uniref:diguanylate cyclase domain-containing protein n=1 Tax=Paenibacillus sp. p3-SID867 TaxID=2916363 RepID=UPI0028833481|nr:diguanylate cyclase [Paenibacillus sp. p3-SID867]
MTISIGITTATPDDNEVTLLHKADEALYASKLNGRNQVTHHVDVRTQGHSQ